MNEPMLHSVSIMRVENGFVVSDDCHGRVGVSGKQWVAKNIADLGILTIRLFSEEDADRGSTPAKEQAA